MCALGCQVLEEGPQAGRNLVGGGGRRPRDSGWRPDLWDWDSSWRPRVREQAISWGLLMGPLLVYLLDLPQYLRQAKWDPQTAHGQVRRLVCRGGWVPLAQAGLDFTFCKTA